VLAFDPNLSWLTDDWHLWLAAIALAVCGYFLFLHEG
jgi:hypothetical protein